MKYKEEIFHSRSIFIQLSSTKQTPAYFRMGKSLTDKAFIFYPVSLIGIITTMRFQWKAEIALKTNS